MSALEVWPAIDLQAGLQVGLVHGDLGVARRYGNPVTFAQSRARDGYTGLHVVDLDGASDGRPVARPAIQAIREAAPDVFLEVGGGIRTVQDATTWISLGVDRVVLGTAAFRDRVEEGDADRAWVLSDVLFGCLDRLGPERLAVAVDTRDGVVLLDAWRKTAGISLDQVRVALRLAGVRFVVHTEASRDGSLAGVREQEARTLADAGFEVAAAGGVASDDDLGRLVAAGVKAAIVGRAFHAGTWRPAPVFKAVSGP